MTMFKFLRREPDLSGMAADLGDTLLERMNAPAPDRAKSDLSVSREDLEAEVRRIDQGLFENGCEISAAEITIADCKIAKSDLLLRRKQVLASIAVLDKATADLDALSSASTHPSKPEKQAKRSRKGELVAVEA